MRGDIETKNLAWASFDIEREQHVGPCPSFIQNRELQ